MLIIWEALDFLLCVFIVNRLSLQIKSDIETRGEFIESLIQKVLAAAYQDIEDVLQFVDWLDNELSSLVIFHSGLINLRV